MPTASKYCKAYPRQMVEDFVGWTGSTPSSTATDNGQEGVLSRYYFVHDNYTVTAGIYLDESVVFNEITPEWIEFCEKKLGFSAGK